MSALRRRHNPPPKERRVDWNSDGYEVDGDDCTYHWTALQPELTFELGTFELTKHDGSGKTQLSTGLGWAATYAVMDADWFGR